MDKCIKKIAPNFNTMVIFSTNDLLITDILIRLSAQKICLENQLQLIIFQEEDH